MGGTHLLMGKVVGIKPSSGMGFPQRPEVANEVIVSTVQGGGNGKELAGHFGHSPAQMASRCLDRVAHPTPSVYVNKV
jgi:hypothetical protein